MRRIILLEFCRCIGNGAMRFQFLLQSSRGSFTMSDELMKASLLLLSQLLEKHYGQMIVILVDE